MAAAPTMPTGAQPCVCSRDLRHLPDGPFLHDRAFRSGSRFWPAGLKSWWPCATAPAPSRKVALTIFNFPPNAGNMGTAAFLSVFESLHATMNKLKEEGYTIEVPDRCGDASRSWFSTEMPHNMARSPMCMRR
jgi:magnesium chelatase subunit H